MRRRGAPALPITLRYEPRLHSRSLGPLVSEGEEGRAPVAFSVLYDTRPGAQQSLLPSVYADFKRRGRFIMSMSAVAMRETISPAARAASTAGAADAISRDARVLHTARER